MTFLKQFLLGALVLLALVIVFTSLDPGPTPPDQTVSQPVVNQPPPTKDITANVKKITKLKLKTESLVLIFDEIGANSFGIANKINSLSKNTEPTIVLINSPGGSVLDGAQIVSSIEASHTPVYTVCMQLCASMAAIIHQHSTKRLMLDRSILMFHEAAGGLQGSFPIMKSRLSLFDRYVKKMAAKIASRAGLSLEQFLVMQSSELWIDAEDAVASKFADGIVNLDLSELNLPEMNLKEKISADLIAKKLGFHMGDQWSN